MGAESAETPSEGRRLDRRGFLGAAAGVAAAGAVASPIAWAAKSQAGAESCDEVAAVDPEGAARSDSLHHAGPGVEQHSCIPGLHQLHEVDHTATPGSSRAATRPSTAISLNSGTNRFPASHPKWAGLSGWETFGSFAKTYGFRLVGDHGGPSPTSAANLGTAITKMNAWHCNQLGAGGGYPGGSTNLPGAGTAITNPSAISAWQASAHTMNAWGQAYQTNSGAGVPGVTPYGPGVFQGTALTAGRNCGRYYRHFHSEQGKWIQNTGTKYDNHYISELIYTETDPFVAYAQSDQCWLLDGLWMAGGSAPSVGLQGPGDPNPGQGKNRLVQPDLMERWQDSVFSFHIKDLGPNDQGTQVRNVGDNDGPGAPVYPYGAVPWATDGSQDTVPFQKIYERFRHPECHEYLFERDGMSNTTTSNAYWRKLLRAGVRHVRQARAGSASGDRPHAVRDPGDARGVGGHGLVPEYRSVRPGAVSARDGRRCTGSRVPARAQGRRRRGDGTGGEEAPCRARRPQGDVEPVRQGRRRHGHLPLAA